MLLPELDIHGVPSDSSPWMIIGIDPAAVSLLPEAGCSAPHVVDFA